MLRSLSRFEYLAPKTVKDCIDLLKRHGQKARVIAGGTDLVPRMKWGEVKPEVVIGLGQIPDLDEIEMIMSSGLKIGALTRVADLVQSGIVNEYYPILVRAASVLGSTEIRNRGTVGGNLCNAAPSADMAPALLVLDAKAVIASGKGERKIPLEEFFAGPGKTVLSDGEILVRLEAPPPRAQTGGEYIKLGIRKAMDIAVVGVAALITTDGTKSVCQEARIALGAVAPVPMRARDAETVLRGKALNEQVIDLASEAASREASPVTDIRASEGYRREMVRTLTRRAILQALGNVAP
ncbi:MAG: xanthine dehydrogenase family protein subunit M [Pseudomonadota bacterium]